MLVSDAEILQAIALYLEKAHNLAEGAGAAPLAAALKLRDRLAGKKVALVLSGGNLSMEQLRRVIVVRAAGSLAGAVDTGVTGSPGPGGIAMQPETGLARRSSPCAR